MVRQTVVIHVDVFFGQCLNEIFLGNAPFVGCRLSQYFSDAHQFIVRDADFVAVHPAFGHGDGFGRTKLEHGPIVLG